MGDRYISLWHANTMSVYVVKQWNKVWYYSFCDYDGTSILIVLSIRIAWNEWKNIEWKKRLPEHEWKFFVNKKFWIFLVIFYTIKANGVCNSHSFERYVLESQTQTVAVVTHNTTLFTCIVLTFISLKKNLLGMIYYCLKDVTDIA